MYVSKNSALCHPFFRVTGTDNRSEQQKQMRRSINYFIQFIKLATDQQFPSSLHHLFLWGWCRCISWRGCDISRRRSILRGSCSTVVISGSIVILVIIASIRIRIMIWWGRTRICSTRCWITISLWITWHFQELSNFWNSTTQQNNNSFIALDCSITPCRFAVLEILAAFFLWRSWPLMNISTSESNYCDDGYSLEINPEPSKRSRHLNCFCRFEKNDWFQSLGGFHGLNLVKANRMDCGIRECVVSLWNFEIEIIKTDIR